MRKIPDGLVAKAVLALAGGQSAADFAQAHGLSSRTVQRWAARPEFQRRVERIRAQALDQAIGVLSSAATTAAYRLHTLAAASENEQVAVAASRAILADLIATTSHARLQREIRELRDRLDAAEKKGPPHARSGV